MRLNAAPAADATVDVVTRDRLVMDHLWLVKALALRLAQRVPEQVETAELMSAGSLGLLEAAARYRPSLGVPFDAFARRRIHGAMLDALRGLDWAPRSLRRLRRDVDAALSTLRHELQREPEPTEIAAALSVTPDEYVRKRDQLRNADLAVRRQGSIDGRHTLEVAADPGECPHAHLERAELRALLAQAIEQLPARERQVLALYYHEERTLADIGAVLGVGESRASQLRTRAIGQLRTILASAVPCVSATVPRRGVTRSRTPPETSRTAALASRTLVKRPSVKAIAPRTPVHLSRISLKRARPSLPRQSGSMRRTLSPHSRFTQSIERPT
jgi:RNA polymerase sigma factor for flagellar operon FliA